MSACSVCSGSLSCSCLEMAVDRGENMLVPCVLVSDLIHVGRKSTSEDSSLYMLAVLVLVILVDFDIC